MLSDKWDEDVVKLALIPKEDRLLNAVNNIVARSKALEDHYPELEPLLHFITDGVWKDKEGKDQLSPKCNYVEDGETSYDEAIGSLHLCVDINGGPKPASAISGFKGTFGEENVS